ncbi:imelysin family protein [Gracilimonas mengyeensis]|uniref:Putative iron-regulated protein n=1 Tax=Gracilimonas mengyeensis TaxID=1302730 RepID=A0A521BHV0_9BACT|nr:imelysin family protein [Gracilimonas mengyeensis]SMO46665.1 putative iron-regulated protein [Gracilimonas mengyeensis]
MKNLFSVAAMLIVLMISGCSNDQPLRPVVETYADIALANYEDALIDAENLNEVVNTFVENPSPATLDSAKKAWLNARETYGQSEAFRFYGGPIDDENGPEGQLNAWPLDESYIDYVEASPNGEGESVGTNIINSPDEFPEITKELIASLNEQGSETNVSSGYHAVEFLLWGQDVSEGPGGGERPYTDYVTGPEGTHDHQERRATYLTEVTELITDDLQMLVNEWEKGQDNYRAFFTSEEQIETSIGRILNGIGKLSKGELAGERMFVSWDLRSKEDEHSCFSDNTHRDIVTNAIGIRNVLLGEYERIDGTVISGPSVLDVIEDANPELAEELKETVNQSVRLTQQIEPPFDQQILSQEGRQQIMEAINSLRRQGDLIAEAAAILGYNVDPDAI